MKKTFLYPDFSFSRNFLLLALLFLVYQSSFAKQSKKDSLLNLVLHGIEDTNKVNCSYRLSDEYRKKGLGDSAIFYGESGLRLAEKLNFIKGIAACCANLGNAEQSKSDYPKAIAYYLRAEENYKKIKNNKGVAIVTGNIGSIYTSQGNYPKSLDYYFLALKAMEDFGDKNGMARNYANIGLVYRNMGDVDKALDYHFKSLHLAEEKKNDELVETNLGSIGLCYMKRKDHKKALEYFFSSLEKSEALGDKKNCAVILGDIGSTYGEMRQPDKAIEYLTRSLLLDQEMGFALGISKAKGNMGYEYILMKEYRKAFDNIYCALIMADSLNSLDTKSNQYSALSVLYEMSDIPLPDSIGGRLLNPVQMRERAIYYYKRYCAVRDEVVNQENKKQIVRKEMNYEFEKKEAAIKAEQDKKDAIAASEKKRQQLFLLLIIALALGIGMVAWAIFRSLRITRKQKDLIETQKHLVEEKQKEILDSIYYARRIQRALITSERYISRNLERMIK
jgi:tetratricopeptide (TPR) repeat protein